MAKISYLHARKAYPDPVLMLLTSHRMDCFLLCLRCLERYTDLSLFKRIYILANAVSADHAAIIRRFQQSRRNVTVLDCQPRGLIPAVHRAQNEIHARHAGDVIIKMDEDLFVTPHWLDHLLDGYQLHQNRPDVPLVMPLSPVSPNGRQALNHFLRVNYPSERLMYVGPPVEENWVYHRWMWEKVLRENLVDVYLHDEPPRYVYLNHATINCVIYDRRLIERVHPYPESTPLGQIEVRDEMAINAALAADRLKVAVLGRSLAHHYSFSRCEEYLRPHVPLDAVWRHMMSLSDRRGLEARRCPTQGDRPLGLAGRG